MSKKTSKLKTILIVAVGVVILFIIAVALSNGSSDDTTGAEPSVVQQSEDKVTLTFIRSEVAKLALDGSGEINERACNNLKRVVRNFDKDADWFSSCVGTFYLDNKDTDQKNVTTVADGERCAVITADQDFNVIDYEFKDEHCKGYETYFEEYTE